MQRLFLGFGWALCLFALFSSSRAWAQTSASTLHLTRSISQVGSVSRAVSVDFSLGWRQSLSLGAEFMRYASYPGTLKRVAKQTGYWKFKAVPVTVNYSVALADPAHRLVPLASFGVAFYGYQSTVKSREALPFSEAPKGAAYGACYGAQAALGLRYRVSRGVFVTARSRYRFLEPVRLTDALENTLIDTIVTDQAPVGMFPRLDFAVGVGFSL